MTRAILLIFFALSIAVWLGTAAMMLAASDPRWFILWYATCFLVMTAAGFLALHEQDLHYARERERRLREQVRYDGLRRARERLR